MKYTQEQVLEMEKAGLLKNRYYIVLEPNEKSEDDSNDKDSFNVRAYATKDYFVESKGEEFYDPTYVVLQGLLGSLHEYFEDIYDVGIERLALEAISKVVPEENLKPEHLERIRSMEGNVITVDFGETH